MFVIDQEDTICAISTAKGMGGISVVRLSGHNAVAIVKKLCPQFPSKPESHRVYYGSIQEHESGTPFDEVLLSYFAKNRSFTGDSTIEVSCHGSPYISEKVVTEMIKAGARLADKGEFTFRAFMNGRIDLTQAESVLSLIESQGRASARVAFDQLKGQLSKEYEGLAETFTWCLAHLEASIDFSTEDIEPYDMQKILKRLEGTKKTIQSLLNSYDKGRFLREGVRIVFVGSPNVGKSSLLNSLLGFERSIVTEMAGTTRDVVGERMHLQGVEAELLDTAGLRPADNVVERLGIEKTEEEVERAFHIYLVLDASQPLKVTDFSALDRLGDKSFSVVINKVDKGVWFKQGDSSRQKVVEELEILDGSEIYSEKVQSLEEGQFIPTSTIDSTGIGLLRENMEGLVVERAVEGQSVLTQARHFELLSQVKESVAKGAELLEVKESPEFAAFEIGEALRNCHKLLGIEYDEQVLDRIFSEFCLGK